MAETLALFAPAAESLAAPVLQRAATRRDWQAVRALRYAALAPRGDIAENAAQAHADVHDSALNAATFLLREAGQAVGTTRSSFASARRRWRLPAHDVFPGEIERAFGAEATLVEASLTLVAPGADPKVSLIRLFRAHMVHCAVEDADFLLAAVREAQIGFFRRMFNMEIVSGPERCPGLALPRVLMALDYRAQSRLLAKRLPSLAVEDLDEAAASLALRA